MSRREGRVFRRCRTCSRTVTSKSRRCDHTDQQHAPCGGEVAWVYSVDVAVPGSKERRRRVRSGFGTKKEALAALREVQQADATGKLVEPTRMTVAEYLADWLAATRNRLGHSLSATGWRDYEIHVRRHITPRIGDIPLQALDRNHIKAFYGWVQDGHSSREGRLPAPKTVHNIHLTLHRALEDAVDDGLIVRNPSFGARQAPQRGPEMLTWNTHQLRAFFEASAEDRLFPIWRLTIMSGMRRGEVLGLRWDDVDFTASTVTVNRQWKRGEQGFILSPPKTSRGRRTIDIDAETVATLKRWRRDQLEERMAYEGEWHETGFIFTRKDGRTHDPDVVSQRFNRMVSRTELPRIRYHDLRHTHATLLLLAGVPPHVVSMRLGHRSVAFTLQRYAHVLPQQQAEAVEMLAAKVLGES